MNRRLLKRPFREVVPRVVRVYDGSTYCCAWSSPLFELLAGRFRNNDNMQSSPTAYELQRAETIRRNQIRMQEIGLSEAVATATALDGKGKKKVQQQRKTASDPTQPRRTSTRINATKQPGGEGPSDRRLDSLGLGSDDEDDDEDYNEEERESDDSSDDDNDDKTSHHEDISGGEAEGNLGTTFEDQGQEKSGGEATPGR